MMFRCFPERLGPSPNTEQAAVSNPMNNPRGTLTRSNTTRWTASDVISVPCTSARAGSYRGADDDQRARTAAGVTPPLVGAIERSLSTARTQCAVSPESLAKRMSFLDTQMVKVSADLVTTRQAQTQLQADLNYMNASYQASKAVLYTTAVAEAGLLAPHLFLDARFAL